MARFVRLDDRAVLSIYGSDASGFLQGLITNDVEKLYGGAAIYAALLTPQGKYLFDFLVFRRGDAFCLDCDTEARPALAKRLAMYKLRAEVAIDAAAPGIVYAVSATTPKQPRVGSRARISSAIRATPPSARVWWANAASTL